MRDKNFTVNFDRLPDFEVAPNVPATKWQEQMEHESESSLLGEVIRFAVRVARLTQAAMEVDKKPINLPPTILLLVSSLHRCVSMLMSRKRRKRTFIQTSSIAPTKLHA